MMGIMSRLTQAMCLWSMAASALTLGGQRLRVRDAEPLQDLVRKTVLAAEETQELKSPGDL